MTTNQPDLLHRIDAAVGELCPCGAPPAPGSAYCSDDCRPTHIAEDTGRCTMRWRPDLVSAFDDADLELLDRHERTDTGFAYCVYTYRSDLEVAHLRVDDGNRFVGIDVPWSQLQASGPSATFRRLERELTDRRRVDPDPDPELPPPPTLGGMTADEFVSSCVAWGRLLRGDDPTGAAPAASPAGIGSPITRSFWGLPVVSSATVPAGEAYLAHVPGMPRMVLLGPEPRRSWWLRWFHALRRLVGRRRHRLFTAAARAAGEAIGETGRLAAADSLFPGFLRSAMDEEYEGLRQSMVGLAGRSDDET